MAVDSFECSVYTVRLPVAKEFGSLFSTLLFFPGTALARIFRQRWTAVGTVDLCHVPKLSKTTFTIKLLYYLYSFCRLYYYFLEKTSSLPFIYSQF